MNYLKTDLQTLFSLIVVVLVVGCRGYMTLARIPGSPLRASAEQAMTTVATTTWHTGEAIDNVLPHPKMMAATDPWPVASTSRH